MLKGRVLAAIQSDIQLVNFDLIPREAESRTKTLKLSRGDAGPLALKVVSATAPQLAAALREVEPGESYELDVTMSPPWPGQRLRAPSAAISRSPLAQSSG